MLRVPMGRAHKKKSTSKLDHYAKRVANIDMDLPLCVLGSTFDDMCK